MIAVGASLSWGYDNFDQLTSATRTNSPNGAADAAYNYGYQYDLIGNRLHENRGQLDLNSTYNPLNQLTYLDWGGKLDVLGITTSTGDIVKVAGQAAQMFGTNYLGGAKVGPGSNAIPVVAWNGTNSTQTNRTVYMPPVKPQKFLYDLNGNITNDEQRAFFWDEENRLVTIESLVGEKRKSEYVYDAQWRRTQKKDLSGLSGSGYSTTNITRFVWDNWLLISDITDTPTLPYSVTNYYVWGLDLSQSLQGAGGIGGLLASIRAPPQTNNWLFAFDGNGNVANVSDDSGVKVASFNYDPFGRLISFSGSQADSIPWKLSTKYSEPWWNLMYYGYRYCAPRQNLASLAG